MNKLIKTLIVLFLSVFFINTAFCSSWNIDNNKTIKQLSNEVQELKQEKEELHKKILELQNTLLKSWFLKENLNIKAKERIKLIIDWYKIQKKQYEKLLIEKSSSLESTKEIKIKLIELKKNLYASLVPYIKENKLNEYLEFVKKDLYTLKEDKDLKENSIKKNVILQEKVKKIKEKIIEHKKETQQILKEKIIKKIDQKIQALKVNNKFKNLKKEQKIKIIDYIIEKINKKIEEMNKIVNKTEILKTKIEIYEILKEKFIKLKEEIEL